MLYTQGLPRIALNGAGRSITINSTIFWTSPAVTASSIDPRETSAELPVSIITRDSSQLPTLSHITRASSCGLSRTEVSFLSKVISWSEPDRGSLNHVLFSALRWYALIELTELQNLEPP
ncbi:hypothetical protein Bca4012_051843 [Brassica carinata]